jgi:hypothetical protein
MRLLAYVGIILGVIYVTQDGNDPWLALGVLGILFLIKAMRLLAYMGIILGVIYVTQDGNDPWLALGVLGILFLIVYNFPSRIQRRQRRLDNDPNFVWRRCRGCGGYGLVGRSIICGGCWGTGGHHVRLDDR